MSRVRLGFIRRARVKFEVGVRVRFTVVLVLELRFDLGFGLWSR